jgi:hypothetical protein
LAARDRAIEPQSRTNFPAELIARGEILAAAGHCAACHTRQGGQPFAGGYALRTQFGTIYSTNITPDPETGIRRWSQEAFARAMHEASPVTERTFFQHSPTTITPNYRTTTSRHCMPIS